MKKATTSANKSKLPKVSLPNERSIDAKPFNTQPLDRDISQEDWDDLLMPETTDTSNWSESQDRSEDLINMRDPFVQEPESNTEIPPELSQSTSGDMLDDDENLADRFDEERRGQSTF